MKGLQIVGRVRVPTMAELAAKALADRKGQRNRSTVSVWRARRPKIRPIVTR